MTQESVNLYDVSLDELFNRVKSYYPNYAYDYVKHIILLKDENRTIKISI